MIENYQKALDLISQLNDAIDDLDRGDWLYWRRDKANLDWTRRRITRAMRDYESRLFSEIVLSDSEIQ